MGSAFRKTGGGFLNHVDSEIQDIQFSDEFNGKAFKAGIDPKTKKERFHSLYAAVTFLVDGATEPQTTTLFVGDADAFEVSADGHSLTPVEDGYQISGNSSFATFIGSLVEAGYVAADPGEEAPYDFSPLIGIRLRTEQKTNAETTSKLGQRKVKGKDGKERAYDRQDLVCETFYNAPDAKQAKKVAGKAIKPAQGKANGKAVRSVTPDAVDVAETAAQALLGYIEAAPENTLAKAKLRTKVLTDPAFKDDPALAKQVVAWLAVDSNIETIQEVVYDTDNGQIVQAPA